MTLLDCVLAAAHSLRANLLRSALTTLGIVIGVAAVIAMVAVGSGAEHRLETMIKNLGSNILVVLNGGRTQRGRRMGRGSLLSLTEQDVVAIKREIPAVQTAVGSVDGAVQIIFGNTNWFTTVVGVMPENLQVRNWTLGEGRNLTAAEVRSASKVALLGSTVVRELFGGTSPLGQTIRIRRVPFTVIGVLAAKGQTPWGRDQDDIVYIPLSTAKKRVLGGRRVRGNLVEAITVKAVSAAAVATAERDVTELLRRRHKLAPHQPNDFFIRNVAQVMQTRVESSRVMSSLLASVAGISLLVGGIGIMNIMLVSVTERTREIGLRIATGARRRDIMRQFVIEALSLSLIGGIAGIALGIAGSVAISHFAEWPVLIGPDAIGIAVLFSALVGVFFGYYPARKAARLDPIEALRHE